MYMLADSRVWGLLVILFCEIIMMMLLLFMSMFVVVVLEFNMVVI